MFEETMSIYEKMKSEKDDLSSAKKIEGYAKDIKCYVIICLVLLFVFVMMYATRFTHIYYLYFTK